jgi:acetyltransferase-like isoleucine patch superfamily enzyme
MKRKFQRIAFYFQKFFIGFVVYIDVRLYMKFYNRLLKRNGLKLKGTPRFIAKSVRFDDFNRITIGDRFVASMNVHLLTHDYSYTTALISIDKNPETDIGVLRNIEIGNNVFIGMNSILLPGVKIGNNVIVGAGSVVRGNIPDYSIIFGNPAKVIGDIREYAKKMKEKESQELLIDKK